MTNTFSKIVDPWWRPVIYLIVAALLYASNSIFSTGEVYMQATLYILAISVLMLVFSLLYHLFHKQWMSAVITLIILALSLFGLSLWLGINISNGFS